MIRDMTHGSPTRLILGFAVPLLAGMIFQQLYTLVDTMIVGRFLGVKALASVGATDSVSFLVLGFGMGICSGFAIPVAQTFGAREESRMREYVANGVWLSFGMAALFTGLTVLFCRDILTLMNTPEDCFQEAYHYIVIIFSGIPFLLLYNLLSGYLSSLGDSKTPLFFLVLSSLINVALDLLFILVFHLGVMGAALATIVSQGISGALCLLWIVLKVPVLHISGDEWKPRLQHMQTLCFYGIPMGLQYSITAIGCVVLQAAVNTLGSLAVAAMTASSKVLNFLACPFDALGSAMATYSAQNVGAGRYDRLNRGVFSASALGFVYSAAALGVACFCGRSLTTLFVDGSGNASLIELAHQYMIVNVAFYPMLTLVNIVRFAIQGMGFSNFAIIAGVLEMIARCLAGAVLVPMLGFLGVALGSPLAWTLADAFLIPAYFRCRKLVLNRTPAIRTDEDSC